LKIQAKIHNNIYISGWLKKRKKNSRRQIYR